MHNVYSDKAMLSLNIQPAGERRQISVLPSVVFLSVE